jgi:OHCU decarboxylase
MAMSGSPYPRDFVGYGRRAPYANWPDHARICVQFVMNYEEGGESCILDGDPASEAFLSEIVGAEPWPGRRHLNMESIYEFGSRVGFWRLHRMFTARGIPMTVFGVATALARNLDAVSAMKEAEWEIASHGLRWLEYRDIAEELERSHIQAAIRIHTELTGERPRGFYQGRTSPHTHRLVMEEGGFLYSADSYASEIPYWVRGPRGPQLIVPYTLDANDMRFVSAQGFNTGDDFFHYLKDSFDFLYQEGNTMPKLLSIGLHCRIIGRPGRAAALARFLDYAQSHEHVWFARRIDVARHWVAHHPPAGGYRPSKINEALFVERYGGVYEHSPWVAELAYENGFTTRDDTPKGLAEAMAAALAQAPHARKMALINAHPDLAGKLALAGKLTSDSTEEQASAGLDRLSPEELARFTALNDAYVGKFGYVFIMAVRGKTKDDILHAFETRLANSPEQEFEIALDQINRIAALRLEGLMGG